MAELSGSSRGGSGRTGGVGGGGAGGGQRGQGQTGGIPRRPSGGASRSAARNKPTPGWVWAGLVISPIVLIVLVLGLNASRRGGQRAVEESQVVQDDNAKVRDLEAQLAVLETDYKRIAGLIRTEDKNAKAQQKALLARMRAWRDSWDGYFRPLEDSEGRLPEKYRGYQSVRLRFNQVYNDLVKSSDF